MRLKTILFLWILVFSLCNCIPIAHAQPGSKPFTFLQYDQVYDMLWIDGYLWACTSRGLLYKVDMGNQAVVGQWNITGSSINEYPRWGLLSMTFDGTDFWLAKYTMGGRYYPQYAGLYKFTVATLTSTEIISNVTAIAERAQPSLVCLNGYVYMGGDGIWRVEIATNKVEKLPLPEYFSTDIIVFGTNLLGITRYSDKLFEVNLTSNEVIEHPAGVYSPKDMALLGSLVYITEATPTIAVVDTTTWSYYKVPVNDIPLEIEVVTIGGKTYIIWTSGKTINILYPQLSCPILELNPSQLAFDGETVYYGFYNHTSGLGGIGSIPFCMIPEFHDPAPVLCVGLILTLIVYNKYWKSVKRLKSLAKF